MAVRFVTGVAQEGGHTVEMRSCFRVFLSPSQRRPIVKARLSKVRIVSAWYQATALAKGG
jgi:hypothetical protein